MHDVTWYDNSIFINSELKAINQLSSRFIYYSLLENTVCDVPPTCQSKADSGLETCDWKNVYDAIYDSTLDTHSRQFQYRVIHNYLCVNDMLHKWKISATNRCHFCFIEKETVDHLFCNCSYAITFYRQIEEWSKKFHVQLPVLNYRNVVLSDIDCNVQDRPLILIILLNYKRLLFLGRTDE